MRILSISDLHLGDGSKADDFVYHKTDEKLTSDTIFQVRLRDEMKGCDLLVLNGDIYELWQQWNEKDISKEYPKLTQMFHRDDVVFIKGNHDHKINKKTEFDISTKKLDIHFQHGHENDPNMISWWVILFNWLFGLFEKNDPDFEEKFTGDSDEKLYEDVENLVLDYFYELNYGSYGLKMERVIGDEFIQVPRVKVLCLGHTHAPGIWKIRDDQNHLLGIYCNSGSCDHGKFDRLLLEDNRIECRTDKSTDSITIFD